MNATAVSEDQLLQLTERVSASLLTRHPITSDEISGEEIKSYFPHNQINSFLLFQVYQVWDQRVQQLRHPYFDFSSEEVQNALDDLKNKLAHHISVDSASFNTLVERAVANSLGFILDPANGFKEFFYPQGQSLSTDQLEQYAHFFSDWDFVVNSILKYCRKHEKSSITWDEFSEKMVRVLEIYEQKKGQKIIEYRSALFQSLTGEDLQAYLNEIEATRKAKEQEAKAKAEAERAEEARRRADIERAKLEAERQAREEEARLKQEAEARRKTIFDDLGGGEALDLDDEPVSHTDPKPQKSEPVDHAEPANHLPELPSSDLPPLPDTDDHAQSPASPVKDDESEFLEMAASMEPALPAQPEEPKTTLDKLANGSTTFLDRFQSKQEQTETPEKATIEDDGEASVTAPTDTTPPPIQPVFKPDADREDSSSVLDKLQEKSQTVADKFAEQTRQRKLHESINGNQKIKLDEIPIHKQYQYVQKVFGGNNVRFRIIVDRVNDARDANEVEDILNKFVLSIEDLDREDQVVQEFVQLLRNRF